MTGIIDTISTISSDLPILGTTFAYLGDVLQAVYDLVKGIFSSGGSSDASPQD